MYTSLAKTLNQMTTPSNQVLQATAGLRSGCRSNALGPAAPEHGRSMERGLSRRHQGAEMTENEIGTVVIDCAIELHRNLGPSLLEEVYSLDSEPPCLGASVREKSSNQVLQATAGLRRRLQVERAWPRRA